MSYLGLALAVPSRRGGPSVHTLAVLRRTNCFSLRQISCKSRLCRQHCPSPPGWRDGRQADGARGRRKKRRRRRGVASGACVPEAPWRRREEGEG